MNVRKLKLLSFALIILVLAQPMNIKAGVNDDEKTTTQNRTPNKTSYLNKKNILASMTTIYFIWRLFPSLKKYYSSDPIVKQLGYNPDPYGKHGDLKQIKEKEVVLAMHGFENPVYSFENDYNKPKGMKVIACNPQSSIGIASTPEMIRSINFGQEQDAMVILKYVLLCNENKNITTINGLGESRGGAAWVTALTMLSEPQNYASAWKSLGVIKDGKVDTTKIDTLKKSLGKVYLAYPWLNSDYPFKNITKGLGWFQSFGVFGIKLGLHLFTNYSMNRDSTHLLLRKLIKNNEFKIILDCAKTDSVVGNEHDEEFKKIKSDKFIAFNNNTRWHMDRPKMFLKALEHYNKD